MKVMFISRGLGVGIGYRVNSMSHYHALIKAVGEDNVFTVDLLFNGAYVKTREALSYCEPKTVKQKVKRLLQFNRTSIRNGIMDDIIGAIRNYKIDIVYLDDASYGKLTRLIKKNYSNIPVITFYHDIVKKLYLKFALQRPVFTIQAFASIYGEKINTKYSDINITLNRRDTRQLLKYYGVKADYEMPVCTGEAHRVEEIKKCEEVNILFVGAKYIPNVKGITWFCNHVFPELREECNLYIVGWQMDFLKDRIQHERIHIMGSVPSLTQYYLKAAMMIGPIFEGGGMKVKTAEALSYGKYYIGTRESLEGYYDHADDHVKRFIRQANTAEEYIREINEAVEHGINNYYPEVVEYYDKYYSVSALNRQMEEIIRSAETLIK